MTIAFEGVSWTGALLGLLVLASLPSVARADDRAPSTGLDPDVVEVRPVLGTVPAPDGLPLLEFGRKATSFSSPIYSANDTSFVIWHAFDRPNGDCSPSGWIGEDRVPTIYAHVSSSFVKNGVVLSDGYMVNMGTKALWVGADATSAPDEVKNWIHPYGYGNNWSQRITSSDSFDRTKAILTFNASIEMALGAPVAASTSTSEFFVVQAETSPNVWTSLTGRFTRTSPDGLLLATRIYGTGTFRCEVRLASDGNESLSLLSSTRLRIVVQTNASASNEDAGVPLGEGAAVIDSLRVRDGSTDVDLTPAVDFEDGTTGSWVLSAYNGYPSPTATTVRDAWPLPGTEVQVVSHFDYNDPTCVWKFTSPSGYVEAGTLATLTSPWFPTYRSILGFQLVTTGKLQNVLSNRLFFNYLWRGKNAGDTRPRVSVRTTSIFFIPVSDSTETGLFSYAVQYPPTGAQVTPAGEITATDSTQVVILLLNRPEVGYSATPATRFPFWDEVAIQITGIDSDHDGVPDADDDCPSENAAGQDADRNGCIDAGATRRHVESWPSGPVRFRLSANGHPAIGDGSDKTEVQAGFLAWEGVGGSGLDLVQDPDTTLKDSSPFDGVNLVTFEDSHVALPPNVLAVTPTLSFLRRGPYWDEMKLPGEIVDADLIFNPAASFSTPTYAAGPGSFDLKSVTVHEAGHFLGLSHSGVLDATMFFVLQPGTEAASLEDDDRAAVASAYPGATLGGDYGAILGRVTRGGSGNPVPGALVTAVKLGPGPVPEDSTASDYTDEDGYYALRRLPPGDYAVRLTPLDGEVGGFPLTPAYISARVEAVAESDFDAEWQDAAEGPADDPNAFASYAVAAGATVSGVDLVTNIDVTPPTVLSIFPADAATGVRIDAGILVDFSERIDSATLQGNFKLHLAGSNPSLGGNGALINGGRTFVFTPSPPLQFNTAYELELLTGLEDRNGVPLAAPILSGFSTETRPTVAISDIQPRSVAEGSYVTVLGAGFDPGATNEVTFTFCGICTPVTVTGGSVTSTSMVAQVPIGAASGDVTVTVDGETSNPFTLAVLPASGQVAPSLQQRFALPPGFSPTDVAVAPDQKTLYAVGQGGFATVNLDPLRPDFHVPVVEPVGSCYQLVLRPDGYRAYATRRDTGDVVVMDADPLSGTYRQKLAEITVAEGASPAGIAMSASGRRAYVTDQYSGTIYTLDTELGSAQINEVIGEAFDPNVMLTGGVAIVPGSGQLLFTTDNQGCRLYDFGAAASSALSTESSARGVVATPSGQEALFVGAGTRSGALLFAGIGGGGPPAPGAIVLGSDLRDVAINPQGKSAFVANAGFNLLQVVDVDPLSPNYHARVAESPTAGAPSAVAVSADGSLIVVAETGSGSLALYNAGVAAQILRVTPQVASPGDQVSVTLSGGIDETSALADLGLGASAPLRAPTTNPTTVSFTVPATFQRDASLAVVEANEDRTLASLLRVVDPIASHAPQATGISLGIGTEVCGITPASGALRVLRTSPDGRLLAVARERSCDDLLEIHRVSAEPGTAFPERLTTVALSASMAPILDLAFTPDGSEIWASIGTEAILIVDADPSSATFGTVSSIALSAGRVPRAFAADPMGRAMLVAISDGDIEFRDPSTHAVQTTLGTGEDIVTLATSPDGRFALAGNVGNATLLNLDSPAVVTTTPDHATGPADHVRSIAVAKNGARALGTFDSGDVAMWSLDAGSVGTELYYGDLLGGITPTQVIPGPDPVSLLAGCAGCTDLLKLDTAFSPPQLNAGPVGHPALSLSLSPDARRVWIGNWDGPGEVGGVDLFSLSPAATMALVAGSDQAGPASATLPTPVRVRLVRANGEPEVGVAVRFDLPSTLGSLDGEGPNAHRLTDPNGEAQVLWTLPNAPGTNEQLDVTALGVSGGVLSVTAAVAGDDAVIPPVVSAFGPTNGATGIRVNSTLYLRFNQRMDSTSVRSNLTLTQGGSARPYAMRMLDDKRVVIVEPTQVLPFNVACTLQLAAGALDQDGQPTAIPYGVTFTTEVQPILSITSLYPPATHPGSPMVISGQGFSPVAAQNIVLFNGVIAPVTSASYEELRVNVPQTATTGPVTVTVGSIVSNPLTYTLPVPPDIGLADIADLAFRPGVQDIAITPDGSHAYVTNPFTSTVSIMQLDPPALLGSITVGLKPQGITILPEGDRAYVANTDSDNLSVIDTDPLSANYNKVIATIPAGDQPVDVAVSPVGPQVLVVNADDAGSMSLIDADPKSGTYNRVVSKTSTGSGSKSVAVSADGTRGFVLTEAGEIAVVDLAPGSPTYNQVTKKTTVGSGGTSVTIKADGTMLLVVFGNGDLAIVDVAPGSATENQVVKKTSTGTGGTSVAISSDGGSAYVSNGIDIVQLLIQLAQGGYGSSLAPGLVVTITPVDTLHAGTSPAGVAFDPYRRRLYVANQGSGTVSILGALNATAVGEAPSAPLKTTLAFAGRVPARGELRLRFSVPSPTRARLEVIDVTGRRIRTIDLGRRAPGWHVAGWDGVDDHGLRVGSGIYFVRLTTDEARVHRRVVWLN